MARLLGVVLLTAFVCAAHARPVRSQPDEQEQLQVEVGDYFKCSSPDKSAVVCADRSDVCLCPPGFFGEINMDAETGKWSGECTPCPKGSWSAAGSRVEMDCAKVPCPELSSGHPDCKCNPGTLGDVDWLYCGGTYTGECREPPQGMYPPPKTTIFSGPHGRIDVSAVTFYFQGNSDADTFRCTLDGTSEVCVAPSVTYEHLAQGPHTFSVVATDDIGQVEADPQVVEFVVDVPCPENSAQHGAPWYQCECASGFYSPSGRQLSYIAGAYPEWCEACQACPAGERRDGCMALSPGRCVPCGVGEFKERGVETSVWTSQCSQCEACAPGEFLRGCGGGSKGSCEACPEGTFKPAKGEWSAQCQACKACPPGSFRVGCGGSSAGLCLPCQDGHYKEEEGAWNAQCSPCEGCKGGFERRDCTATSAGTCAPCELHHFKAVGEEGGPAAMCLPCHACEAGGGGYRSRCGGPQGPGVCEACEECVGVPEDQCFCDV